MSVHKLRTQGASVGCWVGGLAMLAVAIVPANSQAVDGVRWPTREGITAQDPLADLRWPNGGWTCPMSRDAQAPQRAQVALNTLDRLVAQHPSDARSLALRAVPLRLLERLDEARAAIARARALDANSVSDPDVALTDAFLLARAGSYEAAVRAGQEVLPRLSGTLDTRVEATVEVARWSLLRGPSGVADALSLLRGAAAVQSSPSDALRALLCLTLLLEQKVDEARFVARSGTLPVITTVATRPLRGTLAPSLVDVAAAVALAYSGDGLSAIGLLESLAQSQQISSELRQVVSQALPLARIPPRPQIIEPTRPVQRLFHTLMLN